jgi:hypothetical protein
MKIRLLVISLAFLAIAAPARAQVPYDAPSFMPPRPGDDIGVYLSDIGDFGIQGIWRQSGNLNLGLRLGYIDGGGDGAITVGAETWDLLFAAGDPLPVDVAWTLGVGAAINGGTTLEVPVGLTFGLPVDLDQLQLQVYAHPRLGLFVHAVNDDTELDLEGLFDLGVDAALNEDWKLRLGATFGVWDAIGIGMAYRWTRGAIVR